MFTVILGQVAGQPPLGEIISFEFHAGAIIVNKGRRQCRNQGIIRQASLYDSFADWYGFDMPLFPAFPCVPLMWYDAFVLVLSQLLIGLCNPNWGAKNVSLDRAFPSDVLPAVAVGVPKGPERIHIFIVVSIGSASFTPFQTCSPPPLITQLVSLLTCHQCSPLSEIFPYLCTAALLALQGSRIVVTGMKYRIANRPVPCKQRPPDHIIPQSGTTPFGRRRGSIFTLAGRSCSPSLLLLCVRSRYLVWLGEEPTHTQLELEALLLLLLPLLLILQAAADEPA